MFSSVESLLTNRAYRRLLASSIIEIRYSQQPSVCPVREDRKSTRLNSSHSQISYAVFCLKKQMRVRPGDISGWSCHDRPVCGRHELFAIRMNADTTCLARNVGGHPLFRSRAALTVPGHAL